MSDYNKLPKEEDLEKPLQIGLVVDNYKERKFKRALKANGYEYEIHDFTSQAKAFIIHTKKVRKLYKVCRKCEIDLKLSN